MAVSLIDAVPQGKRPTTPTVYLPWWRSQVTGEIVDGPPRMVTTRSDGRPRRPVDRQPVARLLGFFDTYELKDPTGAAKHWGRYIELRAVTPTATAAAPTVSRSDVEAIAAGKADPNEVAVEDLDPDRAAREIKARRDAIADARRLAYNAAMLAVWESADKVAEVFAGVLARCLAAHKDRELAVLWADAVDLLTALRSAGLLPRADGARPAEYHLARPDLAYMWAVANADRARYVGHQHHPAGALGGGRDLMLVVMALDHGPKPVMDLYEIGRHADEWGPGLYSPAEVIANADVYEPADKAELLALHRSR